jgi:hypothetical protein
MGYFVTRRTTFAALSPMQSFEAPRDPFSSPQKWLKLPTGEAEALDTRERRAFLPREVVLEHLDLA